MRTRHIDRADRYVGGVCAQLRSLGNWQAEKEAELEQRISETMCGDDEAGSGSSTTTSDCRIWMLEQKVPRRPLPRAYVRPLFPSDPNLRAASDP